MLIDLVKPEFDYALHLSPCERQAKRLSMWENSATRDTSAIYMLELSYLAIYSTFGSIF